MKIIHCADVHLDSPMTSFLTPEKAKERRQEILRTFLKMIDYAAAHQIHHILIAGDLFDSRNVTAVTRNAVLAAFADHPDICFYYLAGNHDSDALSAAEEEMPANLKLFGEDWTSYALDDEKNMRIALTGAELTGENREALLHSLCPDPRHVNLVMLHGALAEYDAKDREEGIPLSRLRGRGIDYLALGHYHEYREGRIDPRGKYCYAGCLEGRGFDECGPRGFVVVDIDDETYHVTTEFVPFAARLVLEVPVDVSGLDTTAAMCARVREALVSEASPEHLVKVVLTGEVPVECEKDPEFIAAQFAGDYYWLRVQDDTRLFVDYRDFRLDASLKGEFVRTVESDETLSEERKAEIIRCGIRALMGESEQGC